MTVEQQFEAIIRLVLAGSIGSLIGLEREAKDRPAGARTFGVVAIGACLFTLVGEIAMGHGDPSSRVAAQIVTGIGFLGAGTIIQVRSQVVGLTTAAGIWAVAAIGMAFGTGLYVLALGTALLIVLLLRFLRTNPPERRSEQNSDTGDGDGHSGQRPVEPSDAAGGRPTGPHVREP
jgi:putative Mg2+ transporter-C (MgtC) family protein